MLKLYIILTLLSFSNSCTDISRQSRLKESCYFKQSEIFTLFKNTGTEVYDNSEFEQAFTGCLLVNTNGSVYVMNADDTIASFSVVDTYEIDSFTNDQMVSAYIGDEILCNSRTLYAGIPLLKLLNRNATHISCFTLFESNSRFNCVTMMATDLRSVALLFKNEFSIVKFRRQ
jgi:hypothetical protein